MRKLIAAALLGLTACGSNHKPATPTATKQETVRATASSQQQAAVQAAKVTANRLRQLLKQAGATLNDPSAQDVSRDVNGDLSIMGAFPNSDGEMLRIYENGDGSNVPTCSNPNHIHTWDLLGDGWNAVIDGGSGIDNFPVKPQTVAARLHAKLLPLCPGAPTP